MERKVVGVTGRLMALYCPISITGSTLMEHGEEGGRGHRKADGISYYTFTVLLLE